jgi:hypothetical protein
MKTNSTPPSNPVLLPGSLQSPTRPLPKFASSLRYPSDNNLNTGGYFGNVVSNGIHGATIAGGGTFLGENQIGDHSATVGGGLSNTANGSATTVGGGHRTDGNYYSGSDERLKRDIAPLAGVLDRVLQLRPVSYRFRSASEGSRETLGLIAQEVEPVFPEVVGEYDGMKTLAYSELVPVAIGALQQLNQKVESGSDRAEGRIQKLEAENLELKRSVNEPKSLVNALAQKLDEGER